MNERNGVQEVGIVTSARGYLIALEGLPSVRVNDLIESDRGHRALVTALDDREVEAIVLGTASCEPGTEFRLSMEGLEIPLGKKLIGRVIDPLGNPLDGGGVIQAPPARFVMDVVARGIDSRELISEQLVTGIAIVDTLIPLGKGQRELIFGEPRSGKTTFLLDLIKNQKNRDVLCIYAAIGKEEVDVRRIHEVLHLTESIAHTIIISAHTAYGSPIISIAPELAFAFADFFCRQGRDVLLILDDLGTHAKYLREKSLLAGELPGRESYPGDIFYQHAHLLERAGNYNEDFGGGSLTLLPVIETEIENFTNLIPTNLMSSTDGHLLFDSALQAEGFSPAIDVSRSVTRVGRQTQSDLHQELAYQVQSLLAEYQDLKRFSRFGTELSAETQKNLTRGAVLQELLVQREGSLSIREQLLLLSLPFSTFLEDKEVEFVKENKKNFLTVLRQEPELRDADLQESNFESLVNLVERFKERFEEICR